MNHDPICAYVVAIHIDVITGGIDVPAIYRAALHRVPQAVSDAIDLLLYGGVTADLTERTR